MEHHANKFAPWGFVKKIAFRFSFLVFVLYVFFNPNGFIPYIDLAYGYYIRPFQQLIPWIGKHILHLSYTIDTFTNGSGDTTYDYVIILFLFFLAVVGTFIWTAIDHNRKSYNALYYWLTVVVRYYVAFTMLNYGFYKVYKLQFPYPSLNRLLEPYGNSSPMGLAWTYMGYSQGYNYFTGFGEVISGLLLLFRRTKLLGAILALVVAGNIMAINYCFDVPVKLLSTTLTIMSLFLLLQERRRLVDFFIHNKQAAPATMHVPKFGKKWLNISMIVFKVLLVAYVLVNDIHDASDALKQYGDDAAKPPLYGIYNVATFIKKRDTIPPLTTDTIRWNKLIISYAGGASIKMMNDSTKNVAFKTDTVAKRITVFSYSDTTAKSYFAYSFRGKDTLLLHGQWKNNDSLTVVMKKYDLKNFLLINRGFHFINEHPLNK
jgi:hypothetical protein